MESHLVDIGTPYNLVYGEETPNNIEVVVKLVWQISYLPANGAGLGSYFSVKNLTSA